MSDPVPAPPPTAPTDSDNPYLVRDHENMPVIKDKSDAMAVAGLLGNVSRELTHIDKQNVGGDSQFIKARKMDPREALESIVGTSSRTKTQQPDIPSQSIPQPPRGHNPQVVPPNSTSKEIESRVAELEKIVTSYKKILKFKRGISYTINTVNIKGELKNPADILDIISSEIAKGTKTITLKLNDTTKDK
jgi:hypothetical protein